MGYVAPASPLRQTDELSRLDRFDLMLKPVRPAELIKAVNKVLKD